MRGVRRVQGDIFTVKDTPLAIGLPADCNFSDSIASEFNRRFGLAEKLAAKGYGGGDYNKVGAYPACIYTGGVYVVFYKNHYINKATYEDLEIALAMLIEEMTLNGHTSVALASIAENQQDRLSPKKIDKAIMQAIAGQDVLVQVYMAVMDKSSI